MRAKTTKICRGCGLELALSRFEKRYDRRCPGGRRSRCRDCMRAARRRHGRANYRRHAEKIKARIRANYAAHPKAHRRRIRSWKRRNPDMVAGQRERYNARRRKAPA